MSAPDLASDLAELDLAAASGTVAAPADDVQSPASILLVDDH
jgi:hypothetical protein